MGVDFSKERLLHLLDDGENLLGVELFRKGSKTDDVRKEDSDIAALAFELLPDAQNFVYQVTRDVCLQPLDGGCALILGQCAGDEAGTTTAAEFETRRVFKTA